MQRHRNRILASIKFLGDVLEHVLDRKFEVSGAIFQLLTDEVVLREVSSGEPNHRVDDPDV